MPHRAFEERKKMDTSKTVVIIGDVAYVLVPASEYAGTDKGLVALERIISDKGIVAILKTGGFHTAGQLVGKTEGELLRIPSLGRSKLNKVREALHEHFGFDVLAK